MNRYSDPIEYILNFCDTNNIVSKFDIINAKDQLQCLKKKIADLEKISHHPIGWARINHLYDIYDFSPNYNPFLDQNKLVPLYTNKETFNKWINTRHYKPKNKKID